MLAFGCAYCGQLVFFENSTCPRCGSALGVAPSARRLITLVDAGDGLFRERPAVADEAAALAAEITAPAGAPGAGIPGGDRSVPAEPQQPRYRRCGNMELAGCNWLVELAPGAAGPPPGQLCASCRLTRTRPNDADTSAAELFVRAEAAKRRLVFQLLDLGLPVVSYADDPRGGLAFDLLSSTYENVVTGHGDGVITLDLAESDDAHRESVRARLGEPYRTLLGHFRHETGHYYWPRLVGADPAVTGRFRQLFGDDRADYGESLERHYKEGAPGAWSEWYVSAYATMHPWEDWAETFAHYLHIMDALQTAAEYGLRTDGPDPRRFGVDLERFVARPAPLPPAARRATAGFDEIAAQWLPLTYALNAVNRSMGFDDLYPFVLTSTVLDKLSFVHDLATARATR
ncbi:conserved hypothetical protein [Parafrankia sp. Ea1.12]|uniref:zinc-binding metallopeptidase family protein n=1 Tax=Parafrankia sp. Ea1.12 TaxID=573499 RepID=UPI000DA45CAB|nr:putative zinc-binding metallopeptidase [Parafrankia sp. Ea1.12]SQD99677.1 conserved hypothetical protein [Parafrankia sp. Ea1.12]